MDPNPNRPVGRGRALRRPTVGDDVLGGAASVSPSVTNVAESMAAVQVSEASPRLASVSALPPIGRGRGRGVPVAVREPGNSTTTTLSLSSDAGSMKSAEGKVKSPVKSLEEVTEISVPVEPKQTAVEEITAVETESVATKPTPGTSKVPAGLPVLTLKGSDGYTAIHMTRSHMGDPVIKRGEKGTKSQCATNFIKVKIGESKGLYEYRVEFDPDTPSTSFRKKLVGSCGQTLGSTRTFDGQTLYLPKQLEDTFRETVDHPSADGTKVTLTFRLIKKMTLFDSVQFYNVLLSRINKELGLIEMARNYYDPRLTHSIPQHKLEIWPGYATRIEETEGGLMLCLDASHRVLRKTTVLDIWTTMKKGTGDAKLRFKSFMVNQMVMTMYNNACHRIADVSFADSPLSTFKRRDQEVKYIDYYRDHHQIKITNTDQPMLVAKAKVSKRDKLGEVQICMLVPELCNLSGLSADMTTDFKLMKDIAQFTRVTPQQRMETLITYIKNVKESPKAKQFLEDWGLQIEPGFVIVEGRIIQPPTLQFNPSMQLKNPKADFSREACSTVCYRPVKIGRYVVVCTQNDRQKVEAAMRVFKQVCGPLGMEHKGSPDVVTTHGSFPRDFKSALQEYARPGEVQFAVVIMPFPREDVYKAIKDYCLVENVIPSQVILTKTLSNEKRQRSVMQKVALQINCKLGGAIWGLQIPLKSKIMFVGIDVYHDPKRVMSSVTAIVASMDTECTRYYSRTIFQKPHQEGMDTAVNIFQLALEEYREINGAFPDRIIVFRDGVSDGQMAFVRETESIPLQTAFKRLKMEKAPLFTFCVIQKRIPERFFALKGKSHMNPEPGSVIDSTITRKYFYDFFIVSQLVREGTVSPTHYVVVDDNSDIKPDLMQKFAFSMTFMYFNWPGTIRVPAMCQYAHKLAYLAGQTLNAEPHYEHSKNLFYL